ncbi:MAG: hypothetical protein KGL39_19350 [Patescibacteria group bacterium]|nr:hypothetical protein [Patescibacteria group bacterium]
MILGATLYAVVRVDLYEDTEKWEESELCGLWDTDLKAKWWIGNEPDAILPTEYAQNSRHYIIVRLSPCESFDLTTLEDDICKRAVEVVKGQRCLLGPDTIAKTETKKA